MAESRKSTSKSSNDGDAEAEAQKAVDQETEQGFRGVEVDQTPNRAYTVAGQLAAEAVPETAADPAAARREASGS